MMDGEGGIDGWTTGFWFDCAICMIYTLNSTVSLKNGVLLYPSNTTDRFGDEVSTGDIDLVHTKRKLLRTR